MIQANKNHQPEELIAELKSQCENNIDYNLSPLVEKLCSIYKDSIKLIVLYGSCLRTNNYTDGILDFYVIVDDYDNAYQSRFYPLFNKLLPPNVFYIETESGGDTLRAKYAVVSTNDFNKGINKWFHPYLWARFAQPVRLIYTSNAIHRDLFYLCISNSAIRYLNETIPVLCERHITVEQIWTNALSLSYAAELRPESEGRSKEIVKQSLKDFSSITHAALPALTCLQKISGTQDYEISCDYKLQKKYQNYWRLRRWQGKLLSVLRLIKAAFTFHDCVEYAAWKINRHSGIEIEITPALKKYPVIFGFKVLWQLLRRNAIR